VKKENIKAT